MFLAGIHPLYARNQAASSSGTSCASPPPSQAPPCVLPTVTPFTSVLAAQIARLAGSLRHNNRIPGRSLVGGRLHRAARAAKSPAGRADGSWSAPGECQAFIHGVHCLQDTTAVQSPRRGEIFCRRGGIMAKITSCGSPSRGKRCSGTALLQGSVCTRFGAAWTRP